MSARIPFVAGVGARASLGGSAVAIGAAVRAGISRQAHHPTLRGRDHRPFTVAMDPALPADVPVERRLVEMASDACAQALAPLAALPAPPRVDLALAMPDVGPGIGPQVADSFMRALREQLGGAVESERVVRGGRSAGLMALEAAVEQIASGRSRACLWCGVDSQVTPGTLDAWDKDRVLKREVSRWGIVPGEAAAACLLLAGPDGPLPSLAVVRAVATVADRRAPHEPRAGQALTQATRTVLASLPSGQRIDRIYADLNGERDRVDDVGFTLARINQRVASLPCLATPADRLGDVGAASAPLFVALAVTAAQRGLASGPSILIWTVGPGVHSAAALLSIPVVARRR